MSRLPYEDQMEQGMFFYLDWHHSVRRLAWKLCSMVLANKDVVCRGPTLRQMSAVHGAKDQESGGEVCPQTEEVLPELSMR